MVTTGELTRSSKPTKQGFRSITNGKLSSAVSERLQPKVAALEQRSVFAVNFVNDRHFSIFYDEVWIIRDTYHVGKV